MYALTSGNSHAHYNPERYSEAETVNISKEVGYKGPYSIETGRNNGPDPYAAVQSVLEALLKLSSQCLPGRIAREICHTNRKFGAPGCGFGRIPAGQIMARPEPATETIHMAR